MPLNKNVQDAHKSEQLKLLHRSLISIVSVMNRPQVDERLVREAGIKLDPALFPLLVTVEKLGPIGIVELADRLGRDYTTVSRQVSKLEQQGLVSRQEGSTDRRVREAVLTALGKTMTSAIDIARERIARGIFEKWEDQDLAQLVHLMQRFADELEGFSANTLQGSEDRPEQS
ncbi:DNA-binding MarR family transcriptional regulator [Herbaspirillum sp. Sphag1AN]|uniref:MarR family winged helix-turn-helix transcriptional regulator n=1 Tax=unclassified Herbaspirillum TaxID=2624150 RepID=UPI00160912C0|nr:MULTISPECIES: MarR family winged helix-turn-helix transcriptional regulator [unclassified Herbaspirillum]MBB3213077.1 DNA-binding MarR family transcriptional regulator [Herbaspirillum sp. Sphag1AN]MBB3246274.1 DNA-binding MarR family transcriptional regulator [Herbaspirillum sp. Sphag64]